jgi:Zn-finger nucleic acid-binding protein
MRCKIPLRAWRVGGKEIDLCYKCGGAYYEQGELGIPVLVKDLKPAKSECPRCSLRMYIGHFGKKTGPELDYCTTCGGVWIDKGELDKIRPSSSFAGAGAASAAAAAFTGRPVAGGEAEFTGRAIVPESSKPAEAAPPSGSAADFTGRPVIEGAGAAPSGGAAPGAKPKFVGKAAHKPPPYGSWTEYWDEFLLYSPEKGFAWLVREDGHYTLERTTTVRPQGYTSLVPQKRDVRFGDERFQVYDRGRAVLDEAEGETPWIAKPGDLFESAELIAPPKMVTIEKSKGEVEHFYGEYLEPEEVWKGFKLKGDPPERHWVHGAQPNVETEFTRQSKWWTLLFALAFAGLLAGAFLSHGPSGSPAMEQNARAAFPEPFVSKPFKIEKARTVCRLDTHASLDNEWYWLGIEVIDDKGNFAGEFSVQMEHYHGRDSEGRWTEGDGSASALFVVDEPGTYRFRILGEGGRSSGSKSFNRPFSLRVTRDYVPLRYYLLGFVFCFLAAWWLFDKKWAFERMRWSEVIEDDDDD